MQRLEVERKEINLDHERRDKEWAELNNSIQELKVQREKLENQRRLLHGDRKEIVGQIEELKKLEDVKAVPYRIAASEIEEHDPNNNKHSKRHVVKNRTSKLNSRHDEMDSDNKKETSNGGSPPLSAPFGWLKRCASSLLEQTHSNKKRKQQLEIKQSEETTNTRGLSSLLNDAENENGMSVVGGTKETTVYIDKIITVREVTSVTTENAVENTSEGGKEVKRKDKSVSRKL
ncbi:hypothetical protein R6Q59_034625 [Mikania micrantha]